MCSAIILKSDETFFSRAWCVAEHLIAEHQACLLVGRANLRALQTPDLDDWVRSMIGTQSGSTDDILTGLDLRTTNDADSDVVCRRWLNMSKQKQLVVNQLQAALQEGGDKDKVNSAVPRYHKLVGQYREFQKCQYGTFGRTIVVYESVSTSDERKESESATMTCLTKPNTSPGQGGTIFIILQ